MRTPKHHFQVQAIPYRLVPICLAPIMAGDTLKAGTLQARSLSSPIVQALRGWHLEYYFFFCRIIDMEDGEAIIAKMIDEDAGDFASETAEAGLYHGYGINWMSRCLKLIVPHYFRDYGEEWNEVVDGSLPVLQLKSHSWFDNYVATSALPADDTDAEDFENLWSKWQVLSRNRLTTATYEEFLRQQGIKPPPNLREPDADLKIPELIRHYRDWQFPVATINPSDGVSSNAVSWAISDRLQRARRFTEPGFIVGFTTVRPKEYTPIVAGSGNTAVYQLGSAAGALNNAKAWIPPVYVNEPGESLRVMAAGTGPLSQKATTFEYMFDHRDLFLNGDQLVIGTHTGLAVPRRDVPLWKYPTDAGIYAMFTGGTAGTSVITHEGVVTLNIAGRVRKTTA